MQPLGGEIYWYGFCAATGALNQCDQAGRQRGNGSVLRVNYMQSHTQFTPANLVREGTDMEVYTCCCGVVARMYAASVKTRTPH